ncbi:DUF202 domain-containing protein [Pseudomonas putida]|nr:DUF202 domain-containing protein [Pseudomonas putida]
MKKITHNDPGLQPERTSLAWQRTIYAFATIAALSAKMLSTGVAVFYYVFLGLIICSLIFSARRANKYSAYCNSLANEKSEFSTRAIFLTSLTLIVCAMALLTELLLRQQ